MTQHAFLPIEPFRPHWLLRGGHLQTVVGSYLPHVEPNHASVVRHVPLPDGDMLALHEQIPPQWQPGDPVALLVHGLGGGGESPYMVRKADRLCEAGVRSYRLDLRGCGAGMTIAKKICNAGCSADALSALEFIARNCPGSKVSLVGFSMGGNIVLKLAGEMGSSIPHWLKHVIAVAPPVNLTRCCENMRRNRVMRLYDRRFVRGLNQIVQERLTKAPEADHVRLPSPPRCLHEFDQKITAPLSGFRSAEEYYELSDAEPLLGDIAVPTLILADAHDPLIPIDIFDSVRMSSSTEMHVTQGGGHLGYVGAPSRDPDSRWLDWHLVEQVMGESQVVQFAPRLEQASTNTRRAGIAARLGVTS